MSRKSSPREEEGRVFQVEDTTHLKDLSRRDRGVLEKLKKAEWDWKQQQL